MTDPLGLLLGPLLWPFAALLSIVEYWHLRSKRREAAEKEAALKSANKYSKMSMDELLAAQKKAMPEPHQRHQQEENDAA